MAFQEGWQQGMEDGYKLGKDKGHKELKLQEEEEEKKPKTRASEATRVPQNTQNTHSNVTRSNANPETDPAAPKTCTSTKTMHTTEIPPISVTTASNDSKPLSAISSDPTSSISPTASTPSAQNVEINDSAPYNTPKSSSTIQAAHLHTRNTSDSINDPYIVYSDFQILPSSNQSNPEKNRPPYTPTAEFTILYTQSDGSTISLVDYDHQTSGSALRTSPDAVDASKTPYMSMPHHHLPPLPSLQPLSPSPYKRRDASDTTYQALTAPDNDPRLSKKSTIDLKSYHIGQCHSPTLPNSSNITLLPTEYPPTTKCDSMQQRTTPTTNFNPQIIDSDIPQLLVNPGNVPASSSHTTSSDSEHHTLPLTTHSIVIHAQTVIVNYPSASLSTSENGSTNFDIKSMASPQYTNTRDAEHRCHAPASPTNPEMPPRDLSALRTGSRPRPFYSLQRRLRRRQSMPLRGHNWGSYLHHRDFSRAQGWAPFVY